MCVSKQSPECIVNSMNEECLGKIIKAAENGLEGPVRLSQNLKSSGISKSLSKPILEASCGCQTHRTLGRSVFSTQNFILPFRGYDVLMDGKGMDCIRRKIFSETRSDQAGFRNLLRDVFSIVDNLQIPVLCMSKKPMKGDLVSSSLLASILYWLPLKASGRWIKELKYHLSWLFVDGEVRSGETRLEYPERDETIMGKDGKVLYGVLQKWYNIRIRTKTKKDVNRAFRLTLLQGVKRGMPTVDVDFVRESAFKHAKVLSKENKTPDHILDFIEKEVRKLVPAYVEEHEDIGSRISHSSCSEKSVREVGALAECIETYESPDAAVSKTAFASIVIAHTVSKDFLNRMFYHPKLGVFEERYRFDMGAIKRHCREISLEQSYEQLPTYVKFILEPLKCRTITKAPAFVNSIHGGIQKHLWRSLRKKWQFALIGETVGREHIQNLWAETSYCHPDEADEDQFYWVSGDYSAATDNMHMDISQTILDAFCRNDYIQRWFMQRALVNNNISYEGCFKGLTSEDLPKDFRQTNGQLMGCIFSFPLLCIANYLIYKYTIRQIYGVDHLLYKRTPVLINGDDILFRATPDFIDQWTKNIKLVGFSKSVGKNYEAKDFCTINSRYYLPKQDKEIPYLNNGFIFDQKKGVDSDKILEESSINNKLYLMGFADYFRGWDGSCMEKYKHAAQCILLEHRRDIGWSRRTFYDLGLSNIDDQSVQMRTYSERIAASKAAGLIGITKQSQASNVPYSLIGELELPNIKSLYKECHQQKTSLFLESQKKLLKQQEKLLYDRALVGKDPVIGQGLFYKAIPTQGWFTLGRVCASAHETC